MNLKQIAAVATDAAAITGFAQTGASSQFYADMTVDQQGVQDATAASELGSPVDQVGLVSWLQGKRNEGTQDVAHAAFQSVCFSLRSVYVPAA